MKARLLAIGDVHGRAAALRDLLQAIDLYDEDRLVLLGDYVAGGPDSAEVLDIVSQLARQPGTVVLRGNHDDAMLNALDKPSLFAAWSRTVGRDVVLSYARALGSVGAIDAARIGQRHGALLRSTVVWHEEPEAIFVHGGFDAAVPMEQQDPFVLLWQRARPAQPRHISGKVVICGHASQKDGLPRDFGAAICIDTNAKQGGWLTCLDVRARECVQARGAGEIRRFSLLRSREGCE